MSESCPLKITPAALEHIAMKRKPIYLELPKLIENCCFQLQECPVVCFGEPRDKVNYKQYTIEGATVFVPHLIGRIADIDLSVTLNRFLGFKWLVIEGW